MELKEVALQKAKNQVRLLESAKEDYLEFQEQAKVGNNIIMYKT